MLYLAGKKKKKKTCSLRQFKVTGQLTSAQNSSKTNQTSLTGLRRPAKTLAVQNQFRLV